MPTTTFADLSTVTGCEPKPGESFEDYIVRLADKMKPEVFPDKKWETLAAKSQNWYNANLRRIEGKAFDEVDPLEGFEEVPLAEAATDEVEEAAEAVTTPEPLVNPEPPRAPAERSRTIPKAAKAAKAKGAKKAAKPSQKSDKAVGRPGAFSPTAKITLLTKTNPKRAGSKAHRQFALYKSGQTVQQALDAGVPWRDLRWDREQRFISIK